MTQQAIIIRYLKSVRDFGDGWVKAGTIRSKDTPWGFIGFRGDRDCRDLVKARRLERRMNGGFAEVRYIPFKEEELSKEDILRYSTS